ncbi:MAG: hypothetical protein R2716_06140 [Microthrixaceae bacterium]
MSGLDSVTIGETLADLDDPGRCRRSPRTSVPAMTIGVNTSPLAGREGRLLTARLIKARLDQELVGNVSLRVLATERPGVGGPRARRAAAGRAGRDDAREGFELTVGKPQVVTRGDRRDAPRAHGGGLDRRAREHLSGEPLLAQRRGELVEMVNHGTGWVRIDQRHGDCWASARSSSPRHGTGMMHSVFDGWAPWCGTIRTRDRGSVVADCAGKVTPYSIVAIQERCTLFVGPTEDVYGGWSWARTPGARTWTSTSAGRSTSRTCA